MRVESEKSPVKFEKSVEPLPLTEVIPATNRAISASPEMPLTVKEPAGKLLKRAVSELSSPLFMYQ